MPPLHRIVINILLGSAASIAHAAPVTIEVLSAVKKDQRISQANVLLQRNGQQSVIGQTDNQGKVTLQSNFPDDAESLVIIKKEDHSNLIAKCPCKDMTYAISPTLRNLDGMRVVLSWGKNPLDLDSHALYPGNHVFFDSKIGSDANLDVDDVDSYGPETITLQKKHFGETYVFAVHNFSGRRFPDSMGLSASQAKVFVYIGQSLVRTYYVPSDQPGNLWTVFRVDGAGELQDINRLSGINELPNHGQLAHYLDDQQTLTGLVINQAAQQDAKTFNRQGEEHYHAGQLNLAIEFFQRAIEIDAGFGQAYSNLGLTYQKVNRTAEAIWANRKAIALATGPSANTVRASSHYNIARIYEKAGQTDDALRHYHLAREQKANTVYDNAIQRLNNQH